MFQTMETSFLPRGSEPYSSSELSWLLSRGSHREPRALPEDVCRTPFTTERTEAWRSGVRGEAPVL